VLYRLHSARSNHHRGLFVECDRVIGRDGSGHRLHDSHSNDGLLDDAYHLRNLYDGRHGDRQHRLGQ
jgi:hypothetical protein